MSRPLVSIGMPVYNGERFIREALDSLLAQEYEHIELIISDNASTDQTAEICQEYIAKDQRVCYYRNESNLGAVKNFNRAFDISKGKYFVWAGAHDLWHPSFVSAGVDVLEREPDVVLAYPYTMLISIDGKPLGVTPDRIDTRGMSVVQRYKYTVWNLHWCNMVYGVIRSDTLHKTSKFRDILAPDFALLAEMALYGAVAQVPAPLFYRRKNRADELPDEQRKRQLYDLSAREVEYSYEYLARKRRDAHVDSINHAPMGLFDRLRAIVITNICFRFRFKVPWYGFAFAERLLKTYLPSRLRQAFLSFIMKRNAASLKTDLTE
jgi:glycosyltransferase involved in cell wall biosynthesis